MGQPLILMVLHEGVYVTFRPMHREATKEAMGLSEEEFSAALIDIETLAENRTDAYPVMFIDLSEYQTKDGYCGIRGR